MLKRSTCFALAVLFCARVEAAPDPTPTIDFETQSVVVSGITPKGQVAYFSIARELSPDSETTVVRRQAIASDDDGDGSIRLELAAEVPWKSMWIAVDLTTGNYAAAAPAGYPLRLVKWRGLGILRRASGADRIEDARTFADVLVVRAKVGAWSASIGDGADGDDDGKTDNRVAAALDSLKPLGVSPAAPERLLPTDLVVLMDPNALELTVVRAGNDSSAPTVAKGDR